MARLLLEARVQRLYYKDGKPKALALVRQKLVIEQLHSIVTACPARTDWIKLITALGQSETITNTISAYDDVVSRDRDKLFRESQYNYNMAIICVRTSDWSYLGHVYVWPYYGWRYKDDKPSLVMIGIRSSLANFMRRACSAANTMSGIAQKIITGVQLWGLRHGYFRLVADSPIGPMEHILRKCGFNDRYEAELAKIKCAETGKVELVSMCCQYQGSDYTG